VLPGGGQPSNQLDQIRLDPTTARWKVVGYQ
jgi:hypothetical protein